ncbi:uncharacterized protein CLUP02_10641 [Colletotrichum lupini]|uniref:Uncharacterized protein n=1 Tax=Colletotrichum lupini TaxID=145971 RepID=A0A9Q8WJR3_9PEZI|nr:uncharacterized protein CLUP02_10641 [Colletotrichum lupini]UQC85145.1 hypothetical protein CLUP02_10641 [Colletotrichum lupini]
MGWNPSRTTTDLESLKDSALATSEHHLRRLHISDDVTYPIEVPILDPDRMSGENYGFVTLRGDFPKIGVSQPNPGNETLGAWTALGSSEEKGSTNSRNVSLILVALYISKSLDDIHALELATYTTKYSTARYNARQYRVWSEYVHGERFSTNLWHDMTMLSPFSMAKELRETLYGLLERSPPSRPPWIGRFGIFDAGPALVLLQLAGTLARHTRYLILCGTSKTQGVESSVHTVYLGCPPIGPVPERFNKHSFANHCESSNGNHQIQREAPVGNLCLESFPPAPRKSGIQTWAGKCAPPHTQRSELQLDSCFLLFHKRCTIYTLDDMLSKGTPLPDYLPNMLFWLGRTTGKRDEYFKYPAVTIGKIHSLGDLLTSIHDSAARHILKAEMDWSSQRGIVIYLEQG